MARGLKKAFTEEGVARMFFDEVSCVCGTYANYADQYGDDDLVTRLTDQTPTAFWDAEDREIKYRQAA